jgi:hypothetical protein
MDNIKKLFSKMMIDKKLQEQKNILCKIDNDVTSNITCDISKILNENFTVSPIKNVTLSADIYRDIEFWDNVWPNINYCQLAGGEFVSKKLLESPNKDQIVLENRKKILKDCIITPEDNSKFEKLKGTEKLILSTFQDLDENLNDLYNMAYFKLFFLKRFNNIPETLSGYNIYRILVSPLVGVLTPIIYFIVPYLIVIYKFNIKMSFISYLKLTLSTMTNTSLMFGGMKYKTIQTLSYFFSLIFYFQGLFNSFEISRSLFKITKHLTEKINNIGGFLSNSVDLISKYWKDEMTELYGAGKLETLDDEIKYVQSMTLKKYSLFSNFGKQLYSYKNLPKNIIKSILTKIYILDSIRGFTKYKEIYNYGYAEFIKNDKSPIMKLSGLRHPSIDKEKCVANSINIGGPKANNIIITGTNAGGKSVFIKSLLINAIMSQTCTISCCDIAAITPLGHMNSQINVPDTTGHESLFEAEMHRCKNNLTCLKELGSEYSIIVMDEIFSSTNPVEAISGAYAVCKKMSECSNNLLVFTTHFNYLTNLKKTGKFLNYKMETIVDGSDYEFTYKLIPGVNKQFLALEILKKNGFDQDIIDEALLIKKKFV